MHLNEQQTLEVTEMAKLFFTPREIAIFLKVNIEEFIACSKDESDPVYIAFVSGRLHTEYELRKSILQLATSGSSPAQTMMLELLKQLNLKMTDR